MRSNSSIEPNCFEKFGHTNRAFDPTSCSFVRTNLTFSVIIEHRTFGSNDRTFFSEPFFNVDVLVASNDGISLFKGGHYRLMIFRFGVGAMALCGARTRHGIIGLYFHYSRPLARRGGRRCCGSMRRRLDATRRVRTFCLSTKLVLGHLGLGSSTKLPPFPPTSVHKTIRELPTISHVRKRDYSWEFDLRNKVRNPQDDFRDSPQNVKSRVLGYTV